MSLHLPWIPVLTSLAHCKLCKKINIFFQLSLVTMLFTGTGQTSAPPTSWEGGEASGILSLLSCIRDILETWRDGFLIGGLLVFFFSPSECQNRVFRYQIRSPGSDPHTQESQVRNPNLRVYVHLSKKHFYSYVKISSHMTHNVHETLSLRQILR